MWTLLSFTGRFDVAFLEDAIARGAKALPSMPGEKTENAKQKSRDAQMARTRLRRGAMLERLQQRLAKEAKAKKAKGKGKKNVKQLNREQLRVLKDYQSGELRKEANRLTMLSGHGRLKKADNSFVDIGGSTGGFVRTVLDDWEAPDLTYFQDELPVS